MQTIETKLAKILFFKDGYAIFRTQEGFGAKGHILEEDPQTLLDIAITLTGEFSAGKYGREFSFSSYQIIENELFFFLTKVVKGVTKKVARAIAAKHGADFEEMIANKPETLLVIKGIGPKKLKKIIDGWQKHKQIRKLAEFLLPYGFSNTMIVKIYNHFGENSIQILNSSPYRLTEIRGIGFKKADEMARKLGVPFDSLERIKACLAYCLEQNMQNGHTIMEEESLMEAVTLESAILKNDQRMTIAKGDYFAAKESLLLRGVIFATDKGNQKYLSFAIIQEMERYVYDKLTKYSNTNGETLEADIAAFIAEYEKESDVRLGEKQVDAIRLANTNPRVCVICGYAGTGKTTSSKAILKLFDKKYGPNGVVCCALSGVAANRIKKQTGYDSYTIHSLLSIDPATGYFKYNKENPLEYKVVLLDEASMADVTMFYHLLLAIDLDKTTLIMLGDPAQLPPVGAGEIFADILRFGLVKSVTLDKIYRQSEDKVIALFAQDVRNGHVPQNFLAVHQDFAFRDFSIKNYWSLKNTLPESELKKIREDNYTLIANFIAKIAQESSAAITELYKKDPWAGLTYFQVITPMKEGILGTKNLNPLLQDALNPRISDKFFALQSGREFRFKDKVIHLQNQNMQVIAPSSFRDYAKKDDVPHKNAIEPQEKRVYNGQIGLFFSMDEEEDEYYVFYPNENYVAIYSKSDFSNKTVDLAYAITIHKAQGSEFANVVLTLVLAHYMMLNNKLLYTAMTRAKENLIVAGEKYAFEMAAKRKDETKRNTLIKLLCE